MRGLKLAERLLTWLTRTKVLVEKTEGEERDHPCSYASKLSNTGDSAYEKSGRAGYCGCVATISK